MDQYFQPRFYGFVLMSSRKKVLYKKVFIFLRDVLYIVNPKRFTSDYEIALRAAAKIIWPDVAMSGCVFHFRQALRRKTKKKVDITFRQHHKHECRVIGRMMYNLQMLPPDKIPNGFLIIQLQQQAYDLDDAYDEMNEYMQSFWINQIKPNYFSMYKVKHRTNNFIESFNAGIGREMCKHPNIYVFLDFMKKAMVQENHKMARKQQYKTSSKMEKKLRHAWNDLDSGTISIEQFLKINFSS